jgi:hypothetical protein
MCTLLNIKTGGCSEDCSYCAQSSRYKTGIKASKMVDVESVLSAAKIAKENGSTRFCMGAAWRDMRGRKTKLQNIKAMVEGVRAMGMEVCVTLGMIDSNQARVGRSVGPHGLGFCIPTHPLGNPMGGARIYDTPLGWVFTFQPTHWVIQWVAKNPVT